MKCQLALSFDLAIAIVLPGGDFLDAGSLVRDPDVQRHWVDRYAEFGGRQIEPATVLWDVVLFGKRSIRRLAIGCRPGFVESTTCCGCRDCPGPWTMVLALAKWTSARSFRRNRRPRAGKAFGDFDVATSTSSGASIAKRLAVPLRSNIAIATAAGRPRYHR